VVGLECLVGASFAATELLQLPATFGLLHSPRRAFGFVGKPAKYFDLLVLPGKQTAASSLLRCQQLVLYEKLLSLTRI